MIEYLKDVWTARYFWTHLTMSDLRSRWRRSFFGMFWSVIQPLGLTLLVSFVFSRIFKIDFTSYAPYILSGLIVWEFSVTCVVGGSLSFVQADAYIKQCRHPLAIYSLRTMLTALLVLIMATGPLFVWAVIAMPQNFGITWLATVLIFPILALIMWPLATLLAYIGVRFRDLPPALSLVMQALYFVSPVYFETSMFRRGGLDALVDYNPLYHVLQILRAPLLEGQFPTLNNFLYSLGTALIFTLLACLAGRKVEKEVIFYL